ncbi:MAG: enoyl-CoA hydratase/isomerase family protein [Acidobacteria bacterium]|nr:enoyl-CoA hydratase/isomerase family protein [Acidobacteriota bacterium]
MSDLVEMEIRDHVAIVSMRREAKRNAVDRHLADAIDAALNRLEDDPDLWVGILTGTRMVFSAGSDLGAGGDNKTERGGEYGIIRRQRRKPLIAAVEGYALGGGFEIVLACDLVVAASDVTFGLPEVARGVLPTSGALFRAPRGLPLNVAREMILTGERLAVGRAERLGLVNVVTEPGGAVDGALELAAKIMENAPLSVQACVEAIGAIVGDGDALGWDATKTAIGRLSGTADTEEGVRAFLEKRPPVWTGR